MKKRSVIWQVSKDHFQEIINKSSSYSEALLILGLKNRGNNFLTLKKRIECDLINLDKFNENKNNTKKVLFFSKTATPIESFLIENSKHSNSHLKNRLIKENLIANTCSVCKMNNEWNGKILSLQLDHINGISNDNKLENLRLLCPNCHSQTDNFAGKKLKTRYYCSCGNEKSKISKNCNNCTRKMPKPQLKAKYPTREELQKMLWEIPTTKIAKIFDVSDTAVSKWAKKFNLNKPCRGYWTKYKNLTGEVL